MNWKKFEVTSLPEFGKLIVVQGENGGVGFGVLKGMQHNAKGIQYQFDGYAFQEQPMRCSTGVFESPAYWAYVENTPIEINYQPTS